MSIKGRKNLSTLLECSENGEDASSLMLVPEKVENQGTSEGRCSAYETASSKFSTNGEDTIVECATSEVEVSSPSGSTNASSRHIRNLSDTTSKSRSESSPKSHKRKRSSANSAGSFNDSSPDYHFSSSTMYHSTNPAVQKSFSFRSLLNNFTAPVRGGKKQEKQFASVSQSNDLSVSTNNQQNIMAKQEKSSNSSSKERLNAMTNGEPESSRQLSSDFGGQIPTNIDHFRRNYMESVLNSMQDDDPSKSQNIDECIECQVCFSLRPLAQFPTLVNCSHRPCRTCLEVYLKIEIMENRVLVSCPECAEPLHPTDIYSILCMNHQLLLSYERFMVRRVLMLDADTRWCPGRDCDYAVIANSCAACPKLECERPECGTLFCYHCKGEWHANQTCDEARGKSMERMFASAARSGSMAELIGAVSSSSNEPFKPSDLKACPRCHTLIVKMNDGSCNHMICPMCSADFCWLCLKEISDLHYLSPTGCTFWGKKPWTRKKKLLWQIGTLIGAPVGIALIAGLAVPGIICGVPIFVGRKVYQRFAASSKTRRRLLTIAGVSGSLVVSPVLAVLAVGVGVPIMLAYVYGVVPLSLCRNGGCGGSNESTTLENFVEDEQELGLVATGLKLYEYEEQAQLLRKQISDIEKMDRSSMATRVSTNSGFSLNAPSTSAAGGSRPYGNHGHGNQADVISSSSAKINLMVEQRKRKMSAESCVNYENGSTVAQAGSHYHFDNKSVHTVCSGGTEAQSYCCENDENSSIKAMSGSIDGKSLGDSASVRFARQCRANSRPERDLSPSSIYSLNDQQPVGARLPPRLNNSSSQQTPAFLPNNTQVNNNVDGSEITSENVGSADNRDPFRVRTLLDNLRQILNDDDEEQVSNVGKSQKKRPTSSTPKQQHHKSSASVGAAGSKVAAKIQYDNHQRALSVQIPATTSQLRRSMPSLTPQPNQVSTSLTPSGAVLVESIAVTIDPVSEKQPETKNRRRRFVNFFRRSPNEKPGNP